MGERGRSRYSEPDAIPFRQRHGLAAAGWCGSGRWRGGLLREDQLSERGASQAVEHAAVVDLDFRRRRRTTPSLVTRQGDAGVPLANAAARARAFMPRRVRLIGHGLQRAASGSLTKPTLVEPPGRVGERFARRNGRPGLIRAQVDLGCGRLRPTRRRRSAAACSRFTTSPFQCSALGVDGELDLVGLEDVDLRTRARQFQLDGVVSSGAVTMKMTSSTSITSIQRAPC